MNKEFRRYINKPSSISRCCGFPLFFFFLGGGGVITDHSSILQGANDTSFFIYIQLLRENIVFIRSYIYIQIFFQLTDLVFIIMIFVVVVISAGIAYTANIYPNSIFNWATVKKIVFYPYWQMHGELFLDYLRGMYMYNT